MNMAEAANLDFLPEKLRSEVEESASAQGRSVSDVVTEAIDRYIKDQRWTRMQADIRKRAQEKGWTEDDVDRAIAQSRAEMTR
jgi:hypothetical protein